MSHPGALVAAVVLLASPVGFRVAQAQDADVIDAAAQAAEAATPSMVAEEEQVPVQSEDDPAESGSPSTARAGIEEIVVQGGESDSVADLEAADSVTGFDASDLEALGAQSIEDLAGFTPNLEIVTTGTTTPTFFIRGVGLNDFNSNSSGAVAIYQDDIPKNAPALQLQTLYDMEGVNILRGPQGTGPARNASAGAIKLYSRKPGGGFGGYLRSSFGNYNSKDFEGAIEVPIWEDMLSSRFAFRFSQRDGYVTNRCGRDNLPLPDDLQQTAPFQPNRREPNLSTKTNEPGSISICGEQVFKQGRNFLVDGTGQPGYSGTFTEAFVPGFFGPLDEDVPTLLNNLGNWSARGTLLFQPTLDMSWLLTLQGSRRDELAAVGKSYGTSEGYWKCDFDPRQPRDPDECFVRSVLGSQDAAGYVDASVAKLLEASDPCFQAPGAPDPCAGLFGWQKDVLRTPGRLAVADQLANEMDPTPWKGAWNRPGVEQNDVWGLALKGEIALGSSLLLTSATGYDYYDRLRNADLDNSPNTLFEIGTDDEGWQVVQDFQLSGALEDTPFNWQSGAFFLHEVLDVVVDIDLDPTVPLTKNQIGLREYTQKLWSGALWASFDWGFWKDFTLDGGVRYNWERKTIDYLALTQADSANPTAFPDYQTRTWQAPTGTLRLTYRFREDTHVFWKYTRGWKGGHFNATSSLAPIPGCLLTTGTCQEGVSAANPETIDAFEGGLRGSWFEGRLGLDFSAFYYLYDQYQIFTIQQKLGGPPEFVVLNANDSEVYGAEVDLTTRPFPGSFVQLRFSWLESQFLDFVQTSFALVRCGNLCIAPREIEIDNTGNRLLNSPEFKVSLTAEQTAPLGRLGSLTLRYDGAWTAATTYDATESRGIPDDLGNQFLPKNTIGQRAYWLHNLRLGYRVPNGGIELAIYGRNLANKVYKSFAFDASTFSATTVYFLGQPRMYGLTLTTSF